MCHGDDNKSTVLRAFQISQEQMDRDNQDGSFTSLDVAESINELSSNWKQDHKLVIINFSLETAFLPSSNQTSKLSKIFGLLSILPEDISTAIILPPLVTAYTKDQASKLGINKLQIPHAPWFLFNLRKTLSDYIKKLEETRKVAVLDFWQYSHSMKDRFKGNFPHVLFYMKFLEDLLPMHFCPECVNPRDAILKYVGEDKASNSKISCDDRECTVGKWVDCIDSREKMSLATVMLNTYRGSWNAPSRKNMTVLKNETLCGESNQLERNTPSNRGNFNRNKYCDVDSDKPCCKHFIPKDHRYFSENDTCVAKNECNTRNWFDFDLSDFKQAEACRWQPDKGDFRVLSCDEAREKLQMS